MEYWLPNLVGSIIVHVMVIAIILVNIGSVQIYHVELKLVLKLHHHEQVVSASNAGVTDGYLLAVVCQLNSLQKFLVERVQQNQIVG